MDKDSQRLRKLIRRTKRELFGNDFFAEMILDRSLGI
jgi:hypothetical protein